MTDASDVNRHVREYLEYYLAFPKAPGFAVLVDGPWGVGKTHLLSTVLSDIFPGLPVQGENSAAKEKKPAPSFVYVSIFGLKSAAEIDMAVLRSLYPLLSNKRAKIAGEVGRTALRAFNIDPTFELTDILNKFQAKVYVFDDLERCEMSANSVFGYINEFVEHAERKVIVVANEDEIPETDEYRKRREKVIGKTLQVQLALPIVARYFVSKLSNEKAREVCERQLDVIQAVFRQSELSNLRVLQQTLWDFERLLPALTPAHLSKPEGFEMLLRLFFALSFEFKAGRIHAEDFSDRMGKIIGGSMAARDGKPLNRLYVADKRYADLSLYDPVLSDGALADILVKGVIDYGAIQVALDASDYFSEGDEEPWRTVWYAVERSDQAFETALAEMQRRFAAREITIPGEMLHVFGLQIWLADIGILKKSTTEVVADAKQYIDDLYAAGSLDPLPIDGAIDSFEKEFYGGAQFHEYLTSAFQTLSGYLENMRRRSKDDGLPSLAAELLLEMETDPRLYVRRLCWTNGGDTKYANVPILASVDAGTFVSLVLKQPASHQKIILSAFKSRYESAMLLTDLSAERDWLAAVRDQLREQSANAPAIGKWRVERFISWYIAPALDLYDKMSAPEGV